MSGVLEFHVFTTLGADIPKMAKILEFGCGEGNPLRALLRLGYVKADFRPMRQLITTRFLPAASVERYRWEAVRDRLEAVLAGWSAT